MMYFALHPLACVLADLHQVTSMWGVQERVMLHGRHVPYPACIRLLLSWEWLLAATYNLPFSRAALWRV